MQSYLLGHRLGRLPKTTYQSSQTNLGSIQLLRNSSQLMATMATTKYPTKYLYNQLNKLLCNLLCASIKKYLEGLYWPIERGTNTNIATTTTQKKSRCCTLPTVGYYWQPNTFKVTFSKVDATIHSNSDLHWLLGSRNRLVVGGHLFWPAVLCKFTAKNIIF